MGSAAKWGSDLRSAVETADCLFDAIEHVASALIWRSPENLDRAILAVDLARLATSWPQADWRAFVESEVSGQWIAWQWIDTGLEAGEELVLRELTDRKLR